MKLKLITALTLSVLASSSYASSRNTTIFVGDSYQKTKVRSENVNVYGGTFGVNFAFNDVVSALVRGTLGVYDDDLSNGNSIDGWVFDTHIMTKLGFPFYNDSNSVRVYPHVKLGLDIQHWDFDIEDQYGYIADDFNDTSVGFAYGLGIDMAIHKKYILGFSFGGSNIHFKDDLKAKNTQAYLSFGYKF